MKFFLRSFLSAIMIVVISFICLFGASLYNDELSEKLGTFMAKVEEKVKETSAGIGINLYGEESK